MISERASSPTKANGAYLISSRDITLPLPPAPRRCRFADRKVKLSLLGGFSLTAGAREIVLESRKAKALLAYVTLSRNMKTNRECLANLLWSKFDGPRARASLRQALHSVRLALDDEWLGLETGGSEIWLSQSKVITDIEEIEASIAAARPVDSLLDGTRAPDQLLYGYDDIDPEFADWLRVTRENVRQRWVRNLEHQLFVKLPSNEAAKSMARALLQLDPTHEAACQRLMSAYAASGNTAAALSVYGLLWKRLEEDHDVEPSVETQQIYVGIKRGMLKSQSQNRNNSGAEGIGESRLSFGLNGCPLRTPLIQPCL